MSGPATGRQRATGIAAVVVALALVVIGVGVLGATQPAPAPEPSGSPPPVASDDRPALAVDGEISDDDLYHDSRDDLYRVPYGAVPAGTEVTLRLRAAAGDLSEATVRVWDSFEELQALVPMEVVATDPTQGEHGYDYWEATLQTSAEPTVLYYRFIVRDGPTTRYIEDDLAADGGAVPEGNDGGPGIALANSPDSSWQIDVYEPDFTTPAWTRGAVVYQIFPDRFFNGDPANDPSPDAEQGDGGRSALPLRRRVRQRRPAEGVGRPAGGLLPRLPGRLVRRRAARARLLRRRPRRDHRQARRPAGARRHGALPQPDLRRALEPPLRHEQLRRDRPGPRDPGGLRDAPQGGRRPRHPGPAGRRLQPRLVRLAVVRPLRALRGHRGVRGRRLAVPRLVHVPPAGRERAFALRAFDR